MQEDWLLGVVLLEGVAESRQPAQPGGFSPDWMKSSHLVHLVVVHLGLDSTSWDPGIRWCAELAHGARRDRPKDDPLPVA